MQNTMGRLRGFTLVELSIVLVVIGLLVGGILAGQSLLETATSYKYVKELQSFKISYDGFIHTFKEKPGDFSRRVEMLGASANGNGNGLIEWYHQTPGIDEAAFYWQDIKNFNYPDLDKNFRLLTSSSRYLGRDRKREIFYYTYSGDLYFDTSNVSREDAVTLANDGPEGGAIDTASIKASMIASIDKKIDNGKPWTGFIRGHDSRDSKDPFTAMKSCSVSVAGDREYYVGEDVLNCRMLFLLERY